MSNSALFPAPLGSPSRVRWLVFGLACGTSWLMYLHRYVFALIKPQLAEQWSLGKDQLGLLDSAFSLSYTVFQVPLGVAADLCGVRLVLTALILLWCFGLALHAWAPSAAYLWYARATLGAGQSAGFAAINRIAASWFPLRVRTTMQGVAGVLAGRVGGLSSYLLFGTLLLGILQLDWRTAVYVSAGGGAFLGVAFFVLFRDSPRSHPWTNDAEVSLISGPLGEAVSPAPPPSKMRVGEMFFALRPRALFNLLALNVQTILSTFADNIYSNWLPLFLWEVHRLQFKEMGIYSSLPLLGGAIAGVVGGMLNDLLISWTGSRRWSRTAVAATGKGLAALLLFVALGFYDSPYQFCMCLFLVKLVGDWSLTTTWGVVTDIGGRATASVFAFNNAVAGFGLIAAPAVYGYLAEHFGWRVVFITVGVTYILCSLSWLFINADIPIARKTED